MNYDFVNPPTVTYLTSLPSGFSDYTGLSSFGARLQQRTFLLPDGRAGRHPEIGSRDSNKLCLRRCFLKPASLPILLR